MDYVKVTAKDDYINIRRKGESDGTDIQYDKEDSYGKILEIMLVNDCIALVYNKHGKTKVETFIDRERTSYLRIRKNVFTKEYKDKLKLEGGIVNDKPVFNIDWLQINNTKTIYLVNCNYAKEHNIDLKDFINYN